MGKELVVHPDGMVNADDVALVGPLINSLIEDGEAQVVIEENIKFVWDLSSKDVTEKLDKDGDGNSTQV